MTTENTQPSRRVRVVPGGPVLIEGPVEIAVDDGVVVRSDRFLVALCTCRRSKRYPFCDTSHRRKLPRSSTSGDSTG
ncbi:Fe-S protein [Amycolatopsis antarctica]|uniref:Fe-S protein n=1 Tax=Amycolatopsis antarctica TaxID=1854586 RepID=A0A263CW91_9PSEU|nr:CDGSH iron-sulfur domain-containing protein [Amycolatopsis antarctica]OZM70361.1 Fe-S protein [Amycolatopsis antarctica]